MKSINFKDKIEKEIVETIQTNEWAHDAINNVVKDRFVEKETFDQRFDRILEEMRIAREKSDERWERNDQRWENNDRKWEKSRKQWDENNRKWQESREQWKKNDERWEKNQKAINEILSSIKIVEINDEKLKDLFNSTVGALAPVGGSDPNSPSATH